MAPQIQNFTQVEQFIQNHPQEADQRAQAWQIFVGRHPQVAHFELEEEFVAWARTNNVSDTTIWLGKEVRDAYFYIRQQDEEKQALEEVEHTGHTGIHHEPGTVTALKFLNNLLWKPTFLEEDPAFRKLLAEKKEAWLAAHPDYNATSKEWLDYRYGSFENPNAPTLYQQTEAAFREQAETNPKYQKLLEKYDAERKKVYDDPSKDPTLIWHQEEIELHTDVRHELLKKTDPSVTREGVQKHVEAAHWERFTETHREKAESYAAKHKGIQAALAKIKEKEAIREQLKQYEQATGKEIHYVEDKTHKPSDMSVDEASKRLGAITPPKDATDKLTHSIPPSQTPILHGPITPSLGLVDAQGRPLGSKPVQTPSQPLIQRPQPFSQSTQQVSFSTPSVSFSQNTQATSVPQMQPPPRQPRPQARRGRFSPGSALRAANALRPGSATSKLAATITRQAAKRIATFLLSLINPVSGTVTTILILTFIFAIALYPATGGEASPIETGSSTIASCQFTRAGVAQSVKSNILQSIFQEVSQSSGIPASVLAAVAMHENQTFTSSALDDHDAFLHNGFTGIECQPHFDTSPTGALGFMQVQPPLRILPRARPDAYSEPGVRKGAELMGKTLESLTMQDFCDVRSSVYLGAGVLLSKNGMNPPTTVDQVEKTVCGYFGSPCTYEGGFNYGQEARKDFEACQQIQATTGTGIGQGSNQKNVVGFASRISAALEYGKQNVTGVLSYNRMVQDITNGSYHTTTRTGEIAGGTGENGIYWCTNLIIDAYNLAGVSSIQINKGHQAVASMLQFWRTTPGFLFFDYINNSQQTLQRVAPGFVVFFKQTPGSLSIQEFDHVAIVKQISLDQRGNGSMETYDANTPDKIILYPIDNWILKGNLYPLVGFGSIEL